MTAETAEVEIDETPQRDSSQDVDVILPPAGKVTIQGVDCGVRRLKTREFFQLMGILTGGLGPAMGQMGWNRAQDSDEFGGLIMAGFIMAIPQQIPQFIRFVQDIIDVRGDKSDERMVRQYLDNPEIDDLLPIIDAVIENEKDHLYELMGKARAYVDRWTKVFSRE